MHIKGQLPGQHHPGHPVFIQHPGGFLIYHTQLGGGVEGAAGRVAFHQPHNPQIGGDHRIRPGILHQLQKGGQPPDLLVSRQDVAGHVHPGALGVGQPHRFPQSLLVEVSAGGAQAETFSCQIYRVRSVKQRRFQPFPISRGGQQLRNILSHAPSSF